MSFAKYKLKLTHDTSRGWKWRVVYRTAAGQLSTKQFGETHPTQRAAKLAKPVAVADYKAWIAQMDNAANLTGGGTVTVRELGAAYLAEYGPKWVKRGKPTSTATVARRAVELLDELYGDRIADTLELRDLVIAREQLASRPGVKVGGKGKQQKVTAHTVNLYLGHIRGVFVHAREQGWISKATLADLKELRPASRGGAGRKVYEPTPREVALVLREVSPAVAAMIRLQWRTGMRPGEVRAMKAIELAEVQGVLIYTPASHKTEHHGKSRPIAILPRAARLLRRWIESEGVGDGYVFTATNGQPYTKSGYRTAMRRACPKAGVPYWPPKDFRHAFASRMRGLGISGLVTSLLGHSDESTTDNYGHTLNQVIAAAESATKAMKSPTDGLEKKDDNR